MMATGQGSAAESGQSDPQVPDWMLAKRGFNLLLNNKPDEANTFFLQYPDSLNVYAAYSFATFMQALMTFEEDRLNACTTVLKEVEKRCANENSGWFKTVKSKMRGAEANAGLTQNLETQIILADSQLCVAILTFMQSDISGFLKGGWVLRKSWKLYQSAYNDIRAIYKEVVGDVDIPAPGINTNEATAASGSTDDSTGSSPESTHPAADNDMEMYHPDHVPSSPPPTSYARSATNGKYADIDKETVKRLMASVSFGYGLFQLGISLLPTSLLRLTNFLGFSGNRTNGINCLMYARQGVDMRAPLATLALLWYHTIVRPFYAVDGTNVKAGADAATVLLKETEQEYGQSAMFLFFRGRVHRLYSDIPMALKFFQMCTEHAEQRDLKILAMHEVGWCYLIQLAYCPAEDTFLYMRNNSKWSRAYYSYLCGICSGSCQNSTNCVYVKEIKADMAKGPRNNQLDDFLLRRSKICVQIGEDLFRINPVFWRLLVYEVLYLWNALSSCTFAHIERIRDDCKAIPVPTEHCEPMVGLSKLILGNCYGILRNYNLAVESFRQCLAVRKELPHNADDAHISAFASYELGDLLIKRPETKAEGKSVLQHISHYKDYDFEYRLNVRVHHLLKQL